MMYATVAKGSGEGVKFKEYKINFSESFQAHSQQYNLQHLFDLPKLDMEPGDELYFYVEATDNHQQKSRTDVYTVPIQDTAACNEHGWHCERQQSESRNTFAANGR
jgi:hypothetical protein